MALQIATPHGSRVCTGTFCRPWLQDAGTPGMWFYVAPLLLILAEVMIEAVIQQPGILPLKANPLRELVSRWHFWFFPYGLRSFHIFSTANNALDVPTGRI
jgi:hypothetical protein